MRLGAWDLGNDEVPVARSPAVSESRTLKCQAVHSARRPVGLYGETSLRQGSGNKCEYRRHRYVGLRDMLGIIAQCVWFKVVLSRRASSRVLRSIEQSCGRPGKPINSQSKAFISSICKRALANGRRPPGGDTVNVLDGCGLYKV
jgi:hypothetical protein